jgi:hypothetical protein
MLLQLSKHRGRLLAPFFDYVESGGVTGIAGFLPVDNGGRDPVVPRIQLLTTLVRSALVAAVESLRNGIVPLRDAVLRHHLFFGSCSDRCIPTGSSGNREQSEQASAGNAFQFSRLHGCKLLAKRLALAEKQVLV